MLHRFLGSATVMLVFCWGCRGVVLPKPARVQGLGAACSSVVDCRYGMGCVNRVCEANASLTEGQACDITVGCEPGMYCNLDKVCAPAGVGAVNAVCDSSGDCQRGLFCGRTGVFSVCQPGGMVDLGGECTSAADCLAGLGCDLGGHCAAGAPTVAPPVFEGVACEEETEQNFRAYFEVPPPSTPGVDFFRLPFPNEARNRVEGYDLTGFPGLTVGANGMLAQYVAAAEHENGGFGLSQAISMRFTQPLKTIPSGEVELSYGTSNANVYLYKVEPIDPAAVATADGDFGCMTDAFDAGGAPKWKLTTVSGVVTWLFVAGKTKYTCPNTLHFRVRTDNPLESNTLYTLILTTSVLSAGGQTLMRDADLGVMLGATPPVDGDRLARPYKCYAPLRAALQKAANDGRVLDPGQAVLFRTQDATAGVRAVSKTMTSLPGTQSARLEALVKCDGAAVSPCHVDGEPQRDCPATPSSVYDEYHGQLRVPVLQAGERPYVLDGGYIEYTDGNKVRRTPKNGDSAIVQGTENVCFALTVPKQGFDPSGAIVLYGHGSGGFFGSFKSEGQTGAGQALVQGSDLASSLAQGSPSLAILSFDQPLHGQRRQSTLDGQLLYFNVGNPRAMRDNGLQAVADYMQFTRFLKDVAGGSAAFASGVNPALVTELNQKLGGKKRLFVGHSQGGTNGALFTAVTPNTDIGAVVLSGTGGGVIHSMLGKTEPLDFPTLLKTMTAEMNLSEYHPVLNLIQSVAERADPINFGRVMIGIGSASRSLQPLPPVPAMNQPPNPSTAAKSLLHVVGFADKFTPLRTASDLWRTFGTVPVFATNSDVEPADTLIPGFEVSSAARTTKLALSSIDTGAPTGLACNCLPIAMPALNPPRADDGVCTAVTSTDAMTLTRRTTAASVVYRPERDYDGHYVMFEHPAARAQVHAFLRAAAQSNDGFCAAVSPVIPPPP